ncbi:DUF4145 domain-containing protein [Parvibaculum sp.]|uniref:DUF4145 domain-containing protein n=1 Tax=Parvibaculum sp. TaxID=2024848 RepID=UPI001B2DD0E6|nr:DUF4145 domain-containing protein [Parvibaculum sp.]MBO6692940.1 DUF4145 domain-containing protein [Parvibaculum sp.]
MPKRVWAAFACLSCGSLVTAEGVPGSDVNNALIENIYPDMWMADNEIPAQARRYLDQARRTLASPDASVLMSAASLDAMLKEKGLADGSLFARIELAVKNGILTEGMAQWAQRVRLDANNPRHADADVPHLTGEDARRAFDFAKSIAEILYVLPGRMPLGEEGGAE